MTLARPLPVSWDGVPLEWEEWSDQRTTLAYHLPVDQLACHQCGAVDEPLVTRGRRQFRRGILVLSGSSALRASRCRHCGHDVVTDMDTEESWDLEDEDYGPAGSKPAGTGHPVLIPERFRGINEGIRARTAQSERPEPRVFRVIPAFLSCGGRI